MSDARSHVHISEPKLAPKCRPHWCCGGYLLCCTVKLKSVNFRVAAGDVLLQHVVTNRLPKCCSRRHVWANFWPNMCGWHCVLMCSDFLLRERKNNKRFANGRIYPLGPSIKYVTLFLTISTSPLLITICDKSRTIHKVGLRHYFENIHKASSIHDELKFSSIFMININRSPSTFLRRTIWDWSTSSS